MCVFENSRFSKNAHFFGIFSFSNIFLKITIFRYSVLELHPHSRVRFKVVGTRSIGMSNFDKFPDAINGL